MMAKIEAMIVALITNISPLREQISKRRAYLGVAIGSLAFLLSLFLSWSEARIGTNTADTGWSSGWSESAYIAAIPLLLILFKVLLDKPIPTRVVLLIGVISFFLLLVDNVVGRSEWIYHPSFEEVLYSHGKTENRGSTLGAGFWIGFFSFLVIEISGLAWALHHETETGQS